MKKFRVATLVFGLLVACGVSVSSAEDHETGFYDSLLPLTIKDCGGSQPALQYCDVDARVFTGSTHRFTVSETTDDVGQVDFELDELRDGDLIQIVIKPSGCEKDYRTVFSFHYGEASKDDEFATEECGVISCPPPPPGGGGGASPCHAGPMMTSCDPITSSWRQAIFYNPGGNY